MPYDMQIVVHKNRRIGRANDYSEVIKHYSDFIVLKYIREKQNIGYVVGTNIKID